MFFRQLFDRESCTYTYLIADPDTQKVVLKKKPKPTPVFQKLHSECIHKPPLPHQPTIRQPNSLT